MTRRARTLALVALALVFAHAPARAAWQANGNALSLAANVQSAPVAAPDGQGGAYVVWLDTRAGNTDLYAQHVTASGTLAGGWAADGNAVCTDASAAGPPRIAADGLGNAYVTWNDPRSGVFDIYLQKLAPGGVAAGWPANGLAVCNATLAQINPVLLADANGALVAWSDLRGASEDVYVQHVLPNGTADPAWPANGAILSAANQQQAFPAIATDGAGGAIVVWEDGRNGGALTSQLDLYAGRMKSNGAADSTWGNNGALVCLQPGFDQSKPLAVAVPGGGAIFVWLDQRNGNGDIYARRILGNGTFPAGWPADGNEVVRVVGEQVNPVAIPDGSGGVIVAWQDGRDPNAFPTNTDVFALRLQTDGTRAPGWAANGNDLSVQSPDRQDLPAICPDGAGGALVAWKDGRPGAEIYAQHVKGDGTRAAGWAADGLPVCTAFEQQIAPTLVSDGAGGVIVAWQDGRDTSSFPTNTDVFAVRLLTNGTRAAGWAANGNDLSIQPDRQDAPAICGDGAGGALLAWTDGRPGAEIYAQHVRADGTLFPGWAADGLPVCTANDPQVAPTIASDGAGGAICAWEDYRNSLANHDIYALRFLGSGQPPTVGVGTLPANGLALAFAGSHPAYGRARFALTLPAAAETSASIYNPAGRRVASLLAGEPLPGGTTTLAWDGLGSGGRAAPPGMYVLEVLSGGRRAALRFVYLP